MNKQSIIANVNPKKKKTNRKAAAAKLREESFNQAYQKNKEEKSEGEIVPADQSNEEISTKIHKDEVATPNNNTEIAPEKTQEETSPISETLESTQPKKKAKRGPKKKKREDGEGEITYTTISVPQNVSKVVKLASTLMEANKLDFTTEAVRYYIKHLKKSGKLPDMPVLDL
ncbi:FtsZ-interacting cell division protein ZipA [Catalinimonas alkaloidigena]|uniref:hypothetical protein n=1 Tax=Catalinimonas alkaloidigena TaxID=1075417 RepID=UPI0024074424|nr:hypothetical protein [Catalinimonas alkaloidigena]MDF9801327.1 FtsZ-interacting cell division protein ZipA [Catalinimonas alkaloidigena]